MPLHDNNASFTHTPLLRFKETVHHIVLSHRCQRLAGDIDEILKRMGLEDSCFAIRMIRSDLIDEASQKSLSKIEEISLYLHVLMVLEERLIRYETNASCVDLLDMMNQHLNSNKSEFLFKVILLSPTEVVFSQFVSELKIAKKWMTDSDSIPANENVSKALISQALLYLTSLNVYKLHYAEALWMSLSSHFSLIEKIKLHFNAFQHFIEINALASSDPHYSIQRREILFLAGLLKSHLQRDPGEMQRYNAQMLSAQDDKLTLLSDIWEGKGAQHFIIVDIGPAGGATLRSVLELAIKHQDKSIHYVGVEYDPSELLSLNHMLEELEIEGKKPREILTKVEFIEGNALSLSELLKRIRADTSLTHDDDNDAHLMVVMSSVLHEIYSYCAYQDETFSDKDIKKMIPSDNGRYNVAAIYKMYYEGLLSISQNPKGGSFNLRDGVMIDDAEEVVEFKIHDKSWLKMFHAFVDDEKYTHLKQNIDIHALQLGEKIKLEAKYLQEFMLKANWGVESFGNEINEVYCYLRLADHKRLIRQVSKALNINIHFKEAKEYAQQGYRDHIDENKIEICDGMGATHFPPTNMVLKVSVPPELSHANHHDGFFQQADSDASKIKKQRVRPSVVSLS